MSTDLRIIPSAVPRDNSALSHCIHDLEILYYIPNTVQILAANLPSTPYIATSNRPRVALPRRTSPIFAAFLGHSDLIPSLLVTINVTFRFGPAEKVPIARERGT
jgi:hypothetical protein